MEKKRYVGVMVKCKDKILLCKRNNEGSFPGMWSIPGGKLEENETTQEGAKREFLNRVVDSWGWPRGLHPHPYSGSG